VIPELVVISGKGGTGKTSLAAAFAVLADRPVIADCDVDAADLHLLMAPTVRERHEFWGGREAVIRQADCRGSGVCREVCRFGAVLAQDDADGRTRFVIDPVACEGCGVCVRFCPERAIDFPERRSGEWMISETRSGPMVHARLGVAAENSGKLVSIVRREARRVAKESDRRVVIVDGPPGIGCPVIASVTGASAVLVVTEPTLSGEHDLLRTLALTRHFGIPAAVAVNKWDINPEMAARIEAAARESGAQVAGRVRYDPAVTRAQIDAKTAVEASCPAGEDIAQIWRTISPLENTHGRS
jgi:MinD superfamily P-loop ATPase